MTELLQIPAALMALSLLLGLLLGSFLNVVILRLPPRLEWGWRRDCRALLDLPDGGDARPPGIVVERSHCPSCGHPLRAWGNIPSVGRDSWRDSVGAYSLNPGGASYLKKKK